jgi:hypothetical protein
MRQTQQTTSKRPAMKVKTNVKAGNLPYDPVPDNPLTK